MLTNKTLVIGDIHGTGKELEKLLIHAKSIHKELNIIAVGDLFDRAEDGVLVWELILKWRIKSCLGNHELKMLKYLKGERSWLPKHYFAFLNAFTDTGYDLTDLARFIDGLPLIIHVDANNIVVHGGINVEKPTEEDVSYNVYAAFDEDQPMPHDNSQLKNAWWDYYKATSPTIFYGHITTKDGKPRLRPNSVGLDTGACHGRMLTGAIVETGEIYQIPSETDYFDKIKKGGDIIPNEDVTSFMVL